MDYIERMQKSGLINFDEVNTRIEEMDNKRQAVIDDDVEDAVQVNKEELQNLDGDVEGVLEAVNNALKKSQKTTQKQVKALQQTVSALTKKIEELSEELERTQKQQVLQQNTKEDKTDNVEQTPPTPKERKKFKPKNSDYSSDDVKLDKIFGNN